MSFNFIPDPQKYKNKMSSFGRFSVTGKENKIIEFEVLFLFFKIISIIKKEGELWKLGVMSYSNMPLYLRLDIKHTLKTAVVGHFPSPVLEYTMF